MISHQQVTRAARAYLGELAAADRRSPAGPATVGKDDVVISGKAQDIRRWSALVADQPDDSAERMDALTRQVASGEYHPAASDIADQILARSIGDHLGGGTGTR